MKLIFVHYVIEDRGSAQDMRHYVEAARRLGHDVVLYGLRPLPSPFTYSRDLEDADAIVFIFEWTTDLQYGDTLDLARLVSAVPRRRRVVIDCDGGYNDPITVIGDINHHDAPSAKRWVDVCDSLSDKIVQPTFHPLRHNVGTFFFHAYDPGWEVPLDRAAKPYGMCYVGNNWFRWRSLRRVLEAAERVRAAVGPIALVGHGWATPAPWVSPTLVADAYDNDPDYLDGLGVEVVPPVPFHDVIGWMSKAVFTPVIYRPLFDHLRLVTCRTFESPAANTIPIFCQDAEFVAEIYGEEAVALALPDHDPHELILDVATHPESYLPVVESIRGRLRERFTYERQLLQLVEIVKS